MPIKRECVPRVAVIDDDPRILDLLLELLRGEGADAWAFESAEAFLAGAGSYHLVLSDLSMPGMTGLQLLEETRRRDPRTRVVIMTGQGTIETAVEAMKQGASDFLTKPFRTEEIRALVEEVRRLLEAPVSEGGPAQRDFTVGCSQPWRQLLDRAYRVADLPVTVLIRGETGTGKDVLARYIASFGARSHRPLVTINCAAMPEALVESELFGHARGAFSGADAARRGLFEEASGGTLFLDEVGSMGLGPQSKLLRVLEERTVRRVGENRSIDVDVRIIAATNAKLEEAVASGAFRSDLYFRLAVVTLAIPPLRERREDIGLLASHFVKLLTQKGSVAKGITAGALAMLRDHPFPGNVRELRNVIEQALAFSSGPMLTAADVAPIAFASPEFDCSPLVAAPLALTADRLRDALFRSGGNRVAAAKLLGISRSTLYRSLPMIEDGPLPS